MPLDTATDSGAAPATRAQDDTARPANDAVIAAIRNHHGQLAEQLEHKTTSLLDAAAAGECAAERAQLDQWYQTELLPHIVAEEKALYSKGADVNAARLLVRGMLDEHKQLLALVAELSASREPLQTATLAASAHALFTGHLAKENDLLLPALDAAGLDLAAILDGMHEILGHAHEHAAEHDGCGCGGEHDDAGHGGHTGAVPVQITMGPPPEQPIPAVELADGELDVRVLPHGQRHEIIFSMLDALLPGQELVIVNDHDPKPLRYQTAALWPDTFEWTYREAGPQVWRVAIARVG